ncbi:hypothetical protein Q2941_12490 [Bradyrhizobium sp. UFLA05-153]
MNLKRGLKPPPENGKKRSALAQAHVRVAELQQLVEQLNNNFLRKALRLGAADHARQARIRIIEAIAIEATGSQADVQRLSRL